jgi:hypothetical protein
MTGERHARLQQAIDESMPMLQEFLSQIGLYELGGPLQLSSLLDSFSRWVDIQEIHDDDRFYLASRLTSFICEYLIQVHGALRIIQDDRIMIRVPVNVELGVWHEFDPYAIAMEMMVNRSSLKGFLELLPNENTAVKRC